MVEKNNKATWMPNYVFLSNYNMLEPINPLISAVTLPCFIYIDPQRKPILAFLFNGRISWDFWNLALNICSNKYFYEPCENELFDFKYSFYQNWLFVFTDFTKIELVKKSDTNNIALFVLYIKIPWKISCDLSIHIF